MTTKETKNQQTSTVQDLVDRMVSALEQRTNDEPSSLSPEAKAAIESFSKTARELAVLPPK